MEYLPERYLRDLRQVYFAVCEPGYRTLRFVAMIAGGREVERKFHRRFAEYHAIGEWFYFSGELRHAVNQLAGLPESRKRIQNFRQQPAKRILILPDEYKLVKKTYRPVVS